jgi:hypothetical protein
MSETTIQVTLDQYDNPSLAQLASQAWVLEQLASIGFDTSLGLIADSPSVQTFYNGLANGSVVTVPNGSTWTGTISAPNNAYQMTWWALGENAFADTVLNGSLFPGDNDTSVSFSGGNLSVSKNSLNSSTPPAPPFAANYVNYSPNFMGAFSGNYTQYTAGNFQAASGPLATGNTTALQSVFASYGMDPANGYDVGTNLAFAKWGQTSTWAFNLFFYDGTGRLPQGLAMQDEIYLEANGWDALPGSAGWYSAGPSNRYGLGLSFGTYPQNPWGANTPVYAKGTSQFSLQAASTIQYTASDTNAYVWVCVQSGTTGGTSPTFPVPKRFNALINNGLMTVTAFTSGPALAVGDYVSIGTQINACKILSLGTGTGGVGTYNVTTGFSNVPQYPAADCVSGAITGTAFTVGGASAGTWAVGQVLSGPNITPGTYIMSGTYPNFVVSISQNAAAANVFANAPSQMIAAPNVNDGTAVWAFGTLYNAYFSAGVLISSDSNVGTGISFAGNFYQAGIDFTQGVFASGAAAIRLAQNQWLDFTGAGIANQQNLRTLGYLTGDSALTYTVLGQNSFRLADGGAMYSLYNTLDDGSGDMSVHGALAVTGAVSGAGINSLFASPPAIGGTAAAAGKFTTLSTTNNTLDDGSGNITATGNISATQYVGHANGAVQFGSASFTANGSTSLSLTALGPSGAHATVQEWLTIKDSSGTTRYIPCF